ncbi:MAG: hypothetical protein ACTSU6_04850 [Candidatus Njordarchaeales archaeon]
MPSRYPRTHLYHDDREMKCGVANDGDMPVTYDMRYVTCGNCKDHLNRSSSTIRSLKSSNKNNRQEAGVKMDLQQSILDQTKGRFTGNQTYYGQLLGVHKQTIQRINNGEQVPSLDHIQRMLDNGIIKIDTDKVNNKSKSSKNGKLAAMRSIIREVKEELHPALHHDLFKRIDAVL